MLFIRNSYTTKELNNKSLKQFCMHWYGYIIAKLSVYSIQDINRKIPIDCGKCHVKHDMTILLMQIPTGQT